MKNQLLLVTETDYLPVLLSLLDQARTSIDILAFSFAIGSVGGKINFKSAPFEVAEKIVTLKKKRPALKIRLYIEGERDTVDRNKITADYLKAHKIEIKYGATHAKGFCVDNRYVLFGSTNLTNQSILKNNETNLFLQDQKLAAEFEKYFNHLWKGGRHGGVKLKLPFIADGAFKNSLIDLIDSAKKTIDFSIYFFEQKEIEQALIRAHKRGVIIHGFIHDHFAFALSYVRRTKKTVSRLSEAGIKDLKFGPQYLFTHSKYLIADRHEFLLGTGNWLDEDVEIHPQLYIRLVDKKICQQLAKHLKSQMSR